MNKETKSTCLLVLSLILFTMTTLYVIKSSYIPTKSDEIQKVEDE